MSTRTHRAATAAETLAITQSGHYVSPSGHAVSLQPALDLAVHNTELIAPSHHRGLAARAADVLATRAFATRVDVVNESTLTAARALVDHLGPGRVAALNFASAKNPGGGFLNGSQAQEESLARATALYPCLLAQRAYYDANRADRSPLYTDHVIYSPEVPVFRDAHDDLLDRPWHVSIVTAPAPNAGAVAANQPELLDQIEPTFRRRIGHVLALAAARGHTVLVLGAWGCGVFRNDPAAVAGLFAEHLRAPAGPYAAAFEHVTFAVLDRQGDTFNAFAAAFP